MSAPVPIANYVPSVHRRCDPEAQATERVIQYLRESEVMPPVPTDTEGPRHDTRPPSATEANRLDEIATLVGLLTYGEMMNLAAALWNKRKTDSPITEKELPGIWHRWSAT